MGHFICRLNLSFKLKFQTELCRHFIFRINFGFKPTFGFNFGLSLSER